MITLNVGMPRSGTLWRYKIIRDLVLAGGGKDGLEIRKSYFLGAFISLPNADLNTTKIKRLLPASLPSFLGEDYVLNSHARPSNFAKKLIELGKMKVVYGFRDPRDCILSVLEYSKRALPQYSNRFLDIKTQEDAIKFMKKYIQVWREWTNMEGVLVIKYEDMLSDYQKILGGIIAYLELDIPHQKLDQVISTYLPQQKPKEGVKIHFQHGQANRFREKFSPSDLANFNETYGDVLGLMGYER